MSDEEFRDDRPKVNENSLQLEKPSLFLRIFGVLNTRAAKMSPSCSSFEAQDPHDPVISRLATQLFRKTNEYLQGEITAGQDHYTLLEQINRLTITKYTDIRNLAANLNKMLNEYNGKYHKQIKPLLQQIDAIIEQVSWLETQAYRLDAATKQLKQRFKELEER